MPDVKMPQLGESVTEGTLGKWLKQPGEPVGKYEPLVEVITDKVNAEIPSDFEGVMREILVQEGETVHVGTVICRITEAGEAVSSQPTQQETPVPMTEAAPDVPSFSVQPTVPAVPVAAVEFPAAHARYSPAVVRLAQENGVDLTRVTGSGDGGRVTRKDLQTYLATRSQVPSATPVPVASQRSAVSAGGEDEIIIPTPVRKTIARRMVESKHNAPHAWTMMEADVTSLVAVRNVAKADFKRKEGIDLTFLPFFIKATAEALKQYPLVNAAWVDDTIHVKKHIHISIAVATDDALVVPVIHDADRLSIAGLAHAVNDLAARARSGKLAMADVQGGTFTVNNTGAFGSILSQPIINAPQAAILSLESIVKRPVVVNDAIAIRSMVNLCLSLDHRVLDGWISGQFLQAIKARLQSYDVDTPLF